MCFIVYLAIGTQIQKTCSLGLEAHVLSFNMFGREGKAIFFCGKYNSKVDPTSEDFSLLKKGEKRA
jgi:hypothetical protein